jgi:hypothetical protein
MSREAVWRARPITLILLVIVALVALASPAAADESADSAALSFSYHKNPYSLRDLAIAQQPFSNPTPISRQDNATHDAEGVRMRLINGVLYDQPGSQASYGLKNVNAFRVTGDAFFLERAEAQARRLIERRVSAGGAWYFPNPYARDRHNRPGDLITPPWYSGMAQGLALALFTRLYDETGADAYNEAADKTFESFLRRGPGETPYTVTVDSNGYYWSQEWPNLPPDCTLNGHTFAAFGAYHYYRLTRDPRALDVFRGAATTVARYVRAFRNPGWISRYCLLHGTPNDKYHEIHVQQLLDLYRLTGDAGFARLADTLEGDYPDPQVSGKVRVAPGSYTGLRFNDQGGVVAQRRMTVSDTTFVRVTLRARIRHRSGAWFLTSSGPWAGYWLIETPARVYMPGRVIPLSYSPARKLRFAAGEYTARKYDKLGNVEDTLAVHVDAPSSAEVGTKAVVNGVMQVRVSSDPLTDYWLPLGKGLKLD